MADSLSSPGRDRKSPCFEDVLRKKLAFIQHIIVINLYNNVEYNTIYIYTHIYYEYMEYIMMYNMIELDMNI